MVEMNIELIIGVLVFLVVILNVGIPVAQQVIVQGNPMGTIAAEVWNGTAGLAHTMSFTPILSVTSMLKANISSTTNTTAIDGFHGTANLATSNPSTGTGQNANLTVNCENASGEGIVVKIGSALNPALGVISGCPATFTNVSHAQLLNSVTPIIFLNNGSILTTSSVNATAVPQGIGTELVYLIYTPDPTTTGNLTIRSSFTSGDHVAVYLNGALKGNLSSSTESWNALSVAGMNASVPLNVTYVNTNIIASTAKSNTTAGNFTTYPFWDVYMPETPTCAGALITVAYVQEAGTNISLRFNGHLLGTNLSGASPQTWTNGTVGGPDNGWECDVPAYSRIAFEGETGTNATNITSITVTYPRYTNATTINNATFSYDYNIHLGNFTNATLSYYSYGSIGNYTNDATTITPGFNGTYETAYTYGTTNSGLIGSILGMIPVFLGLVALFILAKMFGLMG